MSEAAGPPILQSDPGASYRAAKAGIDAAVLRVLASGGYILGEEAAAFEAEFAAWVGAPHAVGCGNGTDALVLALRALGVGPGSTVATVSHTAVATVAAIELTGAAPLLLDVDPRTYTLDVDEFATVLQSPPTGLPPIRAVVPVHLYGQPAAIEEICRLSARAGAEVVEDCAQAHGATVGGRQVGSWGAAATYSFYPTKNLGAFGDGGAVATGRSELAERMRRLRQYGWGPDRIAETPGLNSRLDEVQAAILRVKLGGLAADNARRREIAARYDAALAGGPVAPPVRADSGGHVFHQYVVRTPRRDEVRERLRRAGVPTAVHYPAAVHQQPAYHGRIRLGPRQCQATGALVDEILSLPMHPHLAESDVERICAELRAL